MTNRIPAGGVVFAIARVIFGATRCAPQQEFGFWSRERLGRLTANQGRHLLEPALVRNRVDDVSRGDRPAPRRRLDGEIGAP